MERAEQPVPASVAGKYSSGPVASMRGGRETDNQDARFGIAKSWHWFAPVGVGAECRAFHSRNIGTVRAKPLAFITRDNIVMNVTE